MRVSTGSVSDTRIATRNSTGASAGKKLGSAFNKQKLDTTAQQAELKRLEEAAKRASATVVKAKEGEA